LREYTGERRNRGPARRRLVPVVVALFLLGTVLVGTGRDPAAAAVGWTPTEAPFPADAAAPAQGVVLQSLSCPTASWCVAVGTYVANNSAALIDTFSGGIWTPTAAPPPTNAPYPGLGAGPILSKVACPAEGFCVAVGTYGSVGLIETLSGGAWSASVAPVPQNAPTGQTGVSFGALACPAVGSCAAMGKLTASPGGVNSAMLFVDTLASGTWTATVEPLPSNASTNELSGNEGPDSVSCPAVGWCVAIGQYYDSAGQADGLIETLSAGTWAATEAPAPPSSTTYLNAAFSSVACPEVGSCEAVGGYSPEDYPSGGNGNPLFGPTVGVIETLSEGTWTEAVAPLPSNASTSTIDSTYTLFTTVACPSASSCIAVGQYTDTAGDHPALIETLTGGTWTPTEAPLPTGAPAGQSSALQAVACPALGSCAAVGSYGDPTPRVMTETLAGGTWTAAQPGLPSNAGPGSSTLTAVSCPILGSCAAIGAYQVRDGPITFPAGLIESVSGATPLVSSTTASRSTTSTITLGQSVTDGSTVTGNATFGSPTGTVSFYVCGATSVPTPCTYLSNPVGSPVTVAAGASDKSTATSPSFTPSGGGYWCFATYYSGDANYSASFDATGDSCVSIPRTPTSTTPASTASTLLFGQTDIALATVTGTAAHGSPSGTVQFFDCLSAVPAACGSQNNPLGAPVSLSAETGNTALAASAPFVPSYGYVGYWCIAAYYSGDAFYSPSSGGITAAAGCVYDTSLHISTITSVPSLPTISLGQTVTDTSTVTGNTTYGTPTGALGFYVCGPTVTPTSCISVSDPVGTPVGLTATGPTTSTATSAPFTPNALGYWCFVTIYSDGGSYTTVDDETTDECFDVVAVPPVVTSAASASAVAKKPFTFTVTATGSPAPSISSPKLPKWLFLTSDGSGTATLHAAKAHKGRYRFTIVAESGATETQQVFTLNVSK
jgi:hypothetical protein